MKSRKLFSFILLITICSVPFSTERMNMGEQSHHENISSLTVNKGELGSEISINSYETAFDGVISPNEYYGTITITAGYNLHYKLDNSIIYLAMEANTPGYVAIGFGTTMSGSDMILGYYSASANIQDSYYTASIKKDAQDDILQFGGSDDGSTTIIEFSRYLVTTDSVNDYAISTDQSTDLVWALGNTDDFTSYHTSRGTTTANFATYAPSEPLGLVSAPGDGKVTLNWNSPNSDGGNSISYKIYRSLTSGSGYTYLNTVADLTYVDTGLDNGQSYYYVVTSSTVKGESIYSNEVNAMPSGAIGEPQSVSSTSGQNYVNLTWSAPLTDGGSAITSYNIYRTMTSGSGYELVGTTSGTKFTDTDVINGLQYYYTVTALNIISEGVMSSEVLGNPIGIAPSPTVLRGTADASSVHLTWNEPISFGGYPFTQYNVYRKFANESDIKYVLVGSNATTYYDDLTVVSLEKYVYIVSAVNSFGVGLNSSSFSILVAQTPYPVNTITTRVGYKNIILNWSVPYDNGFPILFYNIYRAENSNLSDSKFIGSTTNLNFSDVSVSNSVNYYYQITANNSQGEGPRSQPVLAVAGSTPDSTQIIGKVGNKFIFLDWDIPFSNGGSAIISYHLYRFVNDKANEIEVYSGMNTEYTDVNLTNGIIYSYYVFAENQIGNASISNIAKYIPGTTPSTPEKPFVKMTNQNVQVTWQSVEDDGGYPIVFYEIYRASSKGGNFSLLGTNTTAYIDHYALKGKTYYYAIKAVNTMGRSQLSQYTSFFNPLELTAPLNLGIVSGDKVIGLAWEKPIVFDTGKFKEYHIYRSVESNSSFVFHTNTTELNFVDRDLTNGVRYYYYVIAVSEDSSSPQSNMVLGIPKIPDQNSGNSGNGDSNIFKDNIEGFLTFGILFSIALILTTITILKRMRTKS